MEDRRRTLRKWGLRILVSLLAVVALVVGVALVVLHSLDRPWLKRRIQAAALKSAGVDLDYAAVRVSVGSGLAIDGLVVQSPLEMRPFAPELARIGRIEVGWRLGALFGHGPIVERIAIADVSLNVVVDEQGRTSFDALTPANAPPPPPPSPPTPLSHQAAQLLDGAFPVGRIDVSDVKLGLLRTTHGAVSERTGLRGLALAVAATPTTPNPATRLDVALGTPEQPLDLVLSRAAGDAQTSARANVWLTVGATSSAATVAIDLRMREQSFAPSVSADHWFHAQAALQFDPKNGKTVITVDHTDAGDGAATAEASVTIPDTGEIVVQHARGDIDLARLLRWVPPGLAPVTVERAHVHYQVDGLVAGAVVRLADGGSAAIDAELAKVAVSLAGGPLEVSAGNISLHAQPAAGGGVGARGTIRVAGATLAMGKGSLAIDDAILDLDGQQIPDGAISGQVGLRFARLALGGSPETVARGGHVELKVQSLVPGSPDPLTTRGDVAVAFDLASLGMRTGAIRVDAEGTGLRFHTRLDGHTPYAIDLDVPIAHLRVMQAGAVLTNTPARVQVDLRDALPNLALPEASRGVVHTKVNLGETTASVDATKGEDMVDFAVHVVVPSLKVARPFLPPSLAKEAPWDQIGATLQSTGHVEHLRAGALAVDQTTQLDVQRFAFRNVVARALGLNLRSKGNLFQHEANLDLRAQGLAIDHGAPSDDHVTLSASLDRPKRSARFELVTEGRAATKISGAASFDAARRAVPFDLDVHLAGLAPLAPLLATVHGLDGLDVSKLELDFAAHGALLGVVAAVSPDGTAQMEPEPARTAAVEGKIDLRAAHFQWSHGDTGVVAPALKWHADLQAEGARRTVVSHLEAEALHLDLGPKDVDIANIRHESTVTVTGDLRDPDSEMTQETTVGNVLQDFVPGYAVGDVVFAVTGTRARDGVVHVSDLKFANGAAGTTLAVSGNVEVGAARRTLSLTTSLTQDLAHLSGMPDRFKGSGTLAVEANVTSPDLAHYRVQAAVKGKDVNLTLPRAGVELEAANGEVPITVALDVGDNGVALQRSEKGSPYSMLRFTDQHPLLSRTSFLSIARLKTPFVAIAPLVGNLAIDQNVVSLRQFEMGVRGGSITGQCGLDWEGPKSTLELHVRATGVQSSHGEPFDGNIAVVISAGDRTVEGRAEVLRIGERHLLDLLDLQDPLHVDPAMNRIRSALKFGYPDNLRLVFDHGFASAHLQLGGLARLISIGELRGIPMGPIVDKMLAPLLEGLDSDGAAAPGAAGSTPKETP